MTRLEMILIAVSTLSLLGNLFLFAYTRGVLARLLFVSDELGDLQDMVDGFAKHLQSVYELETFYGDQTLQALLEHAVSFNEQLETFEYIYGLIEEDAENENTDAAAEEATEAKALAAQRRAKSIMQGYTGNMCTECQNFTMVRNGTCEKCDTCGATSGCS